MKNLRAILTVGLGIIGFSLGHAELARADSAAKTAEPLVQAAWQWSDYQANAPLVTAIMLTPKAGWHVYWVNPGDAGRATRIDWQLPAGFSAGPMHWPPPQVFSTGTTLGYGYGQSVMHRVVLQVPADAPTQANIEATVHWLACQEQCIPGSAKLSHALVAVSGQPRPLTGALAEAAALPSLSATAQIDGSELRLALEDLPAEAQQGLFLPEATHLIEHGAAFQQVSAAQTVRQSLRLATQPEVPSESLRGLWWDGKTGYWQVEADWGLVAKLGPEAQKRAPQDFIHPTATTTAANPEAPLSLWQALLGALLGGLILNLMPCVFPVLALKALSLAKAGEAQRGSALAYTAGVIVSMLALAGVLLGLRASGQSLGWGFQLQSPAMVSALALLMLALGLWLSGVFHFGGQWMGVGQDLTQRSGWQGSFFTGVLAVVVASPCSGPYMVVALGFALTQAAWISLLVFATLGLGLALPFLLIGFVPSLGRWLPRPGAWMDRFKQWLAFPLYATAVWLLWIVVRQCGDLALLWLGLAGVILAMGLWALPRIWAWGLIVASFASIYGLPVQPNRTAANPSATASVPYDATVLAQLRREGKTVFVDFTADWCATCKVNERLAIDPVLPEFAEYNAVYMVGDWTDNDPKITAALQSFNRAGVPLYVVYRGERAPVLLPQTLTPNRVRTALKGDAS